MGWSPSRPSFSISVFLLAAACASKGSPAGTPEMNALNEVMRWPSPAFQRIGRLAGTGGIPFVGDLAQLAGTHDSTIVVLGVSFGNRALAFERDTAGFVAHYQIDITFRSDDGKEIGSHRSEIVRVDSFAETRRTDESVIFQQPFVLLPGTYTLRIVVMDPASRDESRTERQVEIRRFGEASFSSVAAVHVAKLRQSETEPFTGILSPRGMIPYRGTDTLELYIEGYRLPGPTELPVRVLDERKKVLFSTSVRFSGGRSVESRTIAISDVPPAMEDLVIEVGAGSTIQRVRTLASLGSGMMITDFDAMKSLLRFFLVDPSKMDALRKAKQSEHAEAWRRFWETTDSTPDTPENEAIEEYLSRVVEANRRFLDGPEGWLTDRGEVFITLGEPDLIEDVPITTTTRDSPMTFQRVQRMILWTYYRLDAALGFIPDRETTEWVLESRADFLRARLRAILEEEARRRSRTKR